MTWNAWIRRTHRWLSVAFTAAVIVNIVAMFTMGQSDEALWVGFLALAPLIPLLLTGLYLFVLPYAMRRRSARDTG